MNKIIQGDFLTEIKKLEDCSIDLIATDPPYKVTSRGNSGNSGGMFKEKINMQGKVFKHNDIKVSEFMPELYRVLKEGSHCYVMTNHTNLIEMLNVSQEVGFHFIKSLIWNKGNKVMGTAYMSQFEYILFFRKGKFKRINNCGTSDILSVQNVKPKEKIHVTEKPVELMQILIENSSEVGDIVLDPFMGSGSTAIACVKTGRQFLGYELDEEYFNIANKRVERYINE